MTNIEKSTRHGEYTGYANGAWDIRRTTRYDGAWIAVARSQARSPILAWRLADINAKLAAIDKLAILA